MGSAGWDTLGAAWGNARDGVGEERRGRNGMAGAQSGQTNEDFQKLWCYEPQRGAE